MDLRANTAVDVLIGPFVDKTDGNTTEDGLTLTAAEIKLSKLGQGLTLKNESTSAAFDDDGYYNCMLDATDTNTEGNLVLIVHQSANALPVRHEYNVLSEAAWDSLYAAKDTGFMDINVKAVSDDTTSADNLELDYDGTGYDKSNSTIGTTTTNTDLIAAATLADAVWDEVLTGGTHNVTNSSGRRIRLLAESGSYELGLVWLDSVNGTAGSTDFENGTNVLPLTTPADANTILASLALHGVHVAAGSTVTFAASQENQEWTGADWTLALGGQSIAGTSIIDAVVSGVSTGVPGAIRDCFLNASTFAGGDFISCALGDTITLSGATGYHFFNCHHAEMGASSTIDFGAAVGATEVHIHNWHGKLTILNMKAGDILHFSCSDGSLTLDSTCVAGTINLAGTFGFTDSSSGTTINDLGQMYERVGAPAGASVSADIAVIEGQTDDIGVAGAGLTDLGGMSTAMKAEVNVEVKDVMNTDTLTLPGQGAPPLTPTPFETLAWIYKMMRNRTVQTATLFSLYADNETTVDTKATVSDDGTTAIKQELETGP